MQARLSTPYWPTPRLPLRRDVLLHLAWLALPALLALPPAAVCEEGALQSLGVC